MPHNSLKKLLSRFPYFLDKSDSSNFKKTQIVFNNSVMETYNELFKVYLASKLEKHLLIWKVQEQPHYFDIHFHVSLDNIKSVEIIRNYVKVTQQEFLLDDGTTKTVDVEENIDEVIYTETFEYDENINKFEYLHEGYSETIIPEEKYKITVTTWEEYELTKGFPENSIRYNDEYDHDYSLDNFGEFYNVPRKKYQSVESSEYAKTEPPYNNQASEDDYHYMKRLIYYIEHLNDTPLPVLEIYKLFGIEADMLNRDRLIARMIDINRHLNGDEYDRGWNPQRWEHKDIWCDKYDENLFFIANVNNPSPIQGQSFTFDFKILNSLANEVYNTQSYNLINESIFDDSKTPFLIIPYVNNMILDDVVLYSNNKWTLNTEDIDHDDAIFNFKCFRNLEQVEQDILVNGGVYKVNENDIVSEEIMIKVRGCNTADWYVDSVNGNDRNNGTSKNTAFKTLDKALSRVNGEQNIITLVEGEHSLSKASIISNDTNIITCPNDDVLVWCNTSTFFKVMQDRKLYLQNIRLRHKCCELYAPDTLFLNNNKLNNPLIVKVHRQYCMIETKIEFNVPEDLIYSDKFNVTGRLLTMDNLLVTNEEVDLYIDGNYHSTVTTDNKGVFTVNNLSFNDVKTHSFQIFHKDHKNRDGNKYCRCQSEKLNRTVRRIPTSISLTTPEIIYYNKNYLYSGVLTDEDMEGITGKVLKVLIDNTLVKTVTTDSHGNFTFNHAFDDVNTHTIKIVYDELCRYLESETSETVTVSKIPVTLTVDNLSEAIIVQLLNPQNKAFSNIVQSYSLLDEFGDTPVNGEIQLLEGSNILKRVNPNALLEYNPSSIGSHSYTLKFNPGIGYESASKTFNVNVIKNKITLSIDNTNVAYSLQDNVTIRGLLTAATGETINYGSLTASGIGSARTLSPTDNVFETIYSNLGLGEYTVRINYAENNYFTAASATYTFAIIEAEYVIVDSDDTLLDINIVDSIDSSTIANEYILLATGGGNYAKLYIVDDESDIPSGLTDDDVVLIDSDDAFNLDILLKDEED